MYSRRKPKLIKKKTITSKFRGGQAVNNHVHPGLVGPAMKLISNATNKVASTATSSASKLLDVDLASKADVNGALKKELTILSDPQTRENIKKVVSEGAQTFAIGLNAAQPAINQLLKTTTDAIEKTGSKVGKAGVDIAMNTLEEIPGVGVVIGTIRSLDKAAQAAQSVADAGSEIITATGDTFNQVAKNIENAGKNRIPNVLDFNKNMNIDLNKNLQDTFKKNTNIQKMVGGSISQFHDSTLNPEKFLLQTDGKNTNTNTNTNTNKNKNAYKKNTLKHTLKRSTKK